MKQLFTFLLFFIVSTSYCNIIYVNVETVISNPSGTTWSLAFNDLQEALAASSSGDSIFVAKGTYFPTTSTDRTLSFQILDSVKLFGGFAGTELSSFDLDTRNFELNETILSGDIGVLSEELDNSLHVILTTGVSDQTEVNGFTIRDGYALSFDVPEGLKGGGWYNKGTLTLPSNPSIKNCLFEVNSAGEFGGAIYNMGQGSEASPIILNCQFDYNSCLRGDPVLSNYAGAIYNNGHNGVSSPTIIGCTFLGNEASFAGAIYNNGFNGVSEPIIQVCSFVANGGDNGGCIYNYGVDGKANSQIDSCTFANNWASAGSAIYNLADDGQTNGHILNSTFRNNIADEGGAIWFSGFDDESSKVENCVFDANGENHINISSYSNHIVPVFINCTFHGATSWVVGSDDDNTDLISFTNCIFWGNSGVIGEYGVNLDITYSVVEESSYSIGMGNIFQDPQFVDAISDVFNLRCDSPARDSGTSSGTITAPTTDITGFTRVGNPDMGAYEFGHAEVENDIASGANPILNGTPYIKASSKILNTNNALYQGALFVEMLPGFEVAPTSGQATVFRAEVGGGCAM